MFQDFMEAHNKLISRMIKENENRIKLEALSRRQVKLKPPTPKDFIKGRQDYQYLIKMTQDPDYYELHRKLYIEGLTEAKKLFDSKDEQLRLRELE